MTLVEAIVIIQEDSLYNKEAADIAIEAIKKQIAVHPKKHVNLGCLCPQCGWVVEKPDHYCPGCGQHIDWTWMGV